MTIACIDSEVRCERAHYLIALSQQGLQYQSRGWL